VRDSLAVFEQGGLGRKEGKRIIMTETYIYGALAERESVDVTVI
jgi:hypothetical protein